MGPESDQLDLIMQRNYGEDFRRLGQYTVFFLKGDAMYCYHEKEEKNIV